MKPKQNEKCFLCIPIGVYTLREIEIRESAMINDKCDKLMMWQEERKSSVGWMTNKFKKIRVSKYHCWKAIEM
jgi:hypothetical protein